MTQGAPDIEIVRSTYDAHALQGKGAVITGAASGMGRATAIAFASAGADVFLTDIQAEGLEQTASFVSAVAGSAVRGTIIADLADPDAVDTVIPRAAEALPRLTTLVNVAGVPRGEAADETRADWARVLQINLTAIYMLSRAAAPHIRDAGGGSIVNISSIIAFRSYRRNVNLFAYPASKAGVLGLSQKMANTYGSDNIRVNAICPGLIETPMAGALVGAAERLNAAGTGIPVNRIGQPADIAACALFLASDASRYITATEIPVDGGMSAEVGWDRFLALQS